MVDLLLEEAGPAEWIADRLLEVENVGAPHLIDLEVLSALRRLVALREFPAARAPEVLTGLRELGIVRYPVTALLPRIWQLRSSVTPYDAAYVALSETLEVPLVTTDRRLTGARGHRAEILAYPG